MKTFLAVLCCCASFDAAQAASSHPTWEGIGFVTAVSDVCTQNGIDVVGDFFHVVYAAKATSQNRVDTFSIFNERNFFLLRAAASNGLLTGSTTYAGRVIDNHAFTYDFRATSAFKIVASTDLVTVGAKINNAWNVKKCTVTINSNLAPRPD